METRIQKTNNKNFNINKIINKKSIFIISVTVLAIIKYILVHDLPLTALVLANEDDYLMFRLAKSILDGNWLGSYEYNTLIKSPVFSIFLVLIYRLNIGYIKFLSLINIISVLLFIVAISKIYKSKKVLLLVYIILLFNPITFNMDSTQRLYRNSLIPSLSLMIISGYIALFIRRNNKLYKNIGWLLMICITLPVFYYLREDYIWIFPCIFFLFVLSIIFNIVEKKNIKIINSCIYIIIPIVLIQLLGNYIAIQNEKKYGLKVITINDNTNYSNAMNAIYITKTIDDYPKVNVTKEKIDRLNAISPAFARVGLYIKQYIDSYQELDSNPQDGELENGWFSFAMMKAVKDCGNVTLTDEQNIYGEICNEIHSAFADGKLEMQKTLPFLNSVVWRPYYNQQLIKSIGTCFWFISTEKFININDILVNNKAEADIAIQFEELSNSRVLYEEKVLIDENNTELIENQRTYLQQFKIKKYILNLIIKCYSIFGIILLIIGIYSYIKITYVIIKNIIERKKMNIENWIIISAILGTLFALITIISIIHVTTVNAISTLYLCGGYNLFLAFSILAIIENYKSVF